jgi:hypothetical protein
MAATSVAATFVAGVMAAASGSASSATSAAASSATLSAAPPTLELAKLTQSGVFDVAVAAPLVVDAFP